MRNAIMAMLVILGCVRAQSYYTSDQLRSKIIPIGEWDMFNVSNVVLGLPAGIAANKIVHLNAMIYSDPINGSPAVFRIDHFSSVPLLSGTTYDEAQLGGMIKVESQSGVYKIVLDRGATPPRSYSIFKSNGNSKLVDGTPVSFLMKKTSTGASYNRGVIRIVYLP
jgi:hypothetical protein